MSRFVRGPGRLYKCSVTLYCILFLDMMVRGRVAVIGQLAILLLVNQEGRDVCMEGKGGK